MRWENWVSSDTSKAIHFPSSSTKVRFAADKGSLNGSTHALVLTLSSSPSGPASSSSLVPLAKLTSIGPSRLTAPCGMAMEPLDLAERQQTLLKAQQLGLGAPTEELRTLNQRLLTEEDAPDQPDTHTRCIATGPGIGVTANPCPATAMNRGVVGVGSNEGPATAVGVLRFTKKIEGSEANGLGDPTGLDFSYGAWLDGVNGTAPLHLEPSQTPQPPHAAQHGDVFVGNAGEMRFCTKQAIQSQSSHWAASAVF